MSLHGFWTKTRFGQQCMIKPILKTFLGGFCVFRPPKFSTSSHCGRFFSHLWAQKTGMIAWQNLSGWQAFSMKHKSWDKHISKWKPNNSKYTIVWTLYVLLYGHYIYIYHVYNTVHSYVMLCHIVLEQTLSSEMLWDPAFPLQLALSMFKRATATRDVWNGVLADNQCAWIL